MTQDRSGRKTPPHHVASSAVRRPERRPPAVVALGDIAAGDLVDELRRQVPVLLDDPPPLLVVDLSGLSHVSSGAVAALLWLRGVCSARGVDVRVCRPPRGGGATLRRTGLCEIPESEGHVR